MDSYHWIAFYFFRWLSNAWNVRADWLSGWGSHSKWGIQGLTGLKSRYATTRLLEYYWAISFQPCIKTDANMKKRCLAGLITLKSPGSIPGFATKQKQTGMSNHSGFLLSYSWLIGCCKIIMRISYCFRIIFVYNK